jgi:RNA polymerase subunit RPABC4/transcription elongation factor Spt4
MFDKVRCAGCGKQYDEEEDVCPYCQGDTYIPNWLLIVAVPFLIWLFGWSCSVSIHVK